MDMMIISPEPGKLKEIGQRLLALADNPQQVQWVTWPTAGFQVSVELFSRFDADGEDSEKQAADAPAKRRRGRARKDTDNTTTSEEE